jgi:hypothetical protein
MLPTQSRWFRCWLFGLGLALIAGCGGCGKGDAENGQEPENIKPYAGLTIDVAIPAGGDLAAGWELPLSEWSVLHEAECRL